MKFVKSEQMMPELLKHIPKNAMKRMSIVDSIIATASDGMFEPVKGHESFFDNAPYDYVHYSVEHTTDKDSYIAWMNNLFATCNQVKKGGYFSLEAIQQPLLDMLEDGFKGEWKLVEKLADGGPTVLLLFKRNT